MEMQVVVGRAANKRKNEPGHCANNVPAHHRAPPAGFEPATNRVEADCSNPLSYGGIDGNNTTACVFLIVEEGEVKERPRTMSRPCLLADANSSGNLDWNLDQPNAGANIRVRWESIRGDGGRVGGLRIFRSLFLRVLRPSNVAGQLPIAALLKESPSFLASEC